MLIQRAVRNLLAAAALTASVAAVTIAAAPQADAAVFISVGYAPPAIPVYAQPICPGDGYIWTPGYWAWGPDGYYWVDGAWVLPPYVGGLWTPGWWGWGGGVYLWHPGYWGRTVGYYGGINYGFGYFGVGFYGGYWNGGRFWYNSAYGHFGPGFHGAVYNHAYAGFSGRPGGSSFNAHPPAQFASARGSEAFHGSAVNGASRGAEGLHGTTDYAHGAQGFSGYNRAAGSTYHGSTGDYHGQNDGADAHAPAANYGHAQTYGGSAGHAQSYSGGHSAPAPHVSSGSAPHSSGGGGSHGGGGGHSGGHR
jgi:hypothetical protein